MSGAHGGPIKGTPLNSLDLRTVCGPIEELNDSIHSLIYSFIHSLKIFIYKFLIKRCALIARDLALFT